MPRIPHLTVLPMAAPEARTGTERERALLAGINELRETGTFCGDRGYFGPVRPLRSDHALQQAARAHARDMAGRRYVGHVNPDGRNFVDRARQAGYHGSAYGETLAAHLRDPKAVLFGFQLSDGHCAVLMQSDFSDVGVGFHAGDSGYWTVLLGAPEGSAGFSQTSAGLCMVGTSEPDFVRDCPRWARGVPEYGPHAAAQPTASPGRRGS